MNTLSLMNIVFAVLTAKFAWSHEQALMIAVLVMLAVANLAAFGIDAYYDAKRDARRRS